MKIVVEALVNPTEDPGKVEKALGAVLKGYTLEKRELSKETILLRAKAQELNSLTPLQALLRQDRIRDAARAILFSGVDGKTIRFGLNKQVAYVDHVSFSEQNEELPLGSINVEILCDNPESVIDWIAPRSR
jgi:predicted RNA binding protein with dsRBD fold (UPF0201 family)